MLCSVGTTARETGVGVCIDGVRVSSCATYLTLTGFFEPATTINTGLSSSLAAAVVAVVAAVDAMMVWKLWNEGSMWSVQWQIGGGF